MKKTQAPFSPATIDSIKKRQTDPRLHPYTCAGCSPARILYPTTDGLVCAFCGDSQTWVYATDTRTCLLVNEKHPILIGNKGQHLTWDTINKMLVKDVVGTTVTYTDKGTGKQRTGTIMQIGHSKVRIMRKDKVIIAANFPVS